MTPGTLPLRFWRLESLETWIPNGMCVSFLPGEGECMWEIRWVGDWLVLSSLGGILLLGERLGRTASGCVAASLPCQYRCPPITQALPFGGRWYTPGLAITTLVLLLASRMEEIWIGWYTCVKEKQNDLSHKIPRICCKSHSLAFYWLLRLRQNKQKKRGIARADLSPGEFYLHLLRIVVPGAMSKNHMANL